MKYYLDLVTGLDWSAALVDAIVIGSALGALVVSVVLNVRDARPRSRDRRRTRSSKAQS